MASDNLRHPEEENMKGGSIRLNGMVSSASYAGDYDRRIVLLTRERGRITAFARGARKTRSALLASTVPFAFGIFTLYEGRNTYTCVGAEISNYFEDLKSDYIGACYGSYFLEFADYYAREGIEGTDMLNLLYAALLSLEAAAIPDELIRYAFEVRLMVQGGEFPVSVTTDESLHPATRHAFSHMITSPLGRLFSFGVRDDIMLEISKKQDAIRERYIDRNFKSLSVLETLVMEERSHS